MHQYHQLHHLHRPQTLKWNQITVSVDTISWFHNTQIPLPYQPPPIEVPNAAKQRTNDGMTRGCSHRMESNEEDDDDDGDAIWIEYKQTSDLETIDTEWRTHGWLDVKSFNLLPAFW